MATRILPHATKPETGAKPAAKRTRHRPAAVPAPLHPQADAPSPAPASPDVTLWGHVGLRIAGDDATRWYPIDQQQAGALVGHLLGGSAWIATATLNNRALLIQAAAVQRLVLLEADADKPEGEWGVDWRNDQGYSQGVYRGLYACYLASDHKGRIADALPTALPEVRDVAVAHGLDEQSLYSLLRLSRLHYRDGTTAALPLDAGASWAVFSAAEQGMDLPALLPLACHARGMDFYAPRDQVALLDMPLHLMLDAAQDELGELRRESERRALLKQAA